MSNKEKLDIKQTFLIGLGFFAVSISWSVYNAYVPLMLSRWLESTTIIGMIMAIDNVFGVIFQPMFGKLSDKTNTKLGKRMPYILIGAPVAAAIFALVPYTNALWSLMASVILFNFVMSAWRSPVVALMPDLTPAHLRSQGNGIINLWGGIGSVIAFLVGGILYNKGGMPMPFLVSAITMVVAAIILGLTVKENEVLRRMGQMDKPEAEDEQKTEEKPQKLSKGEKISLILILCAIFFWFCGYNALETYFTLYATNTFPQLSEGDASMMLAFFSVAFLIMAVPSGYIAAKIGRKRSVLMGLSLDIVCFLLMYFLKDLTALRILMVIGGCSWAFVNINSLPMVVEMARGGNVGTFTGYYYAFSQTASIAAPILFGFIRDLAGKYDVMFLFGAVTFICAALCILFVRHGEAAGNGPVKAAEVFANLDD